MHLCGQVGGRLVAGGSGMILTGTVHLSIMCFLHISSRLAQACFHVSES